MTVHTLKTWPLHFADVALGLKTAELRRDDLGGFLPFDVLRLVEYDPAPAAKARGYTGRELRVQVTHVLRAHDGLAPGFVLLSFALVEHLPHPPAELVVDVAAYARSTADGVVVRCDGRDLTARPYWRGR